MIGRNSPLDRVRSRTRSGLGSSSVRPGGNGAARKRTSRAGVRPLARREEIVLATILEKPVDYIDSEVFLRPDAEEHIYGLEEVDRPDVSWYRPLMEDVLPSRGRPEMTKKGKLSSGDKKRGLAQEAARGHSTDDVDAHLGQRAAEVLVAVDGDGVGGREKKDA